MDATAGITYVPLQTRSRSRRRKRRWILAISARRTIVFDTDTEELIPGPDLLSEKESPALVYVEDKIYALSTFPQIKGERDLEPWFEVLDLSTARVVDGRLQGCSWEELPSPPCFPSPSPGSRTVEEDLQGAAVPEPSTPRQAPPSPCGHTKSPRRRRPQIAVREIGREGEEEARTGEWRSETIRGVFCKYPSTSVTPVRRGNSQR